MCCNLVHICISVLWSKHFFEIPTIVGRRSVVCSPCIMCPAGHYPPQHKQAGLQIQRNTNRNTASNSSEIRIQQIQSSMGSTESLCFPDILMSSFEGSWDTLFMRESRTIPLLTMPALSWTSFWIPRAQKIPCFHHDRKPLFVGNVVWYFRKNRPVLPLIQKTLFWMFCLHSWKSLCWMQWKKAIEIFLALWSF